MPGYEIPVNGKEVNMSFYKLPLDRKVAVSEIALNHPPPGHGKIPDAGSC